jgi:hypothetical protein
MSEKEHKELREHIVFLKKIVDDAPHATNCVMIVARQAGFGDECSCWKSKEKITPPYSIPEKKKL